MECDNNRRKKIRLVATGGTIASRAAGRVATEGYTPSVIPAEQLLKDLPELSERMDVSCEQIFLKPSSAITESDLFDLSERVNELLMSDECDGIVITHGTDTMEETAYFLNLTVKSSKPVVVTGAMRPQEVISSDGALNLYNAFLCAESDFSRGMGVVISMNDLIISARDAVKFSTFKTDAYQAPLYGVLGTVRNGQVDYAYRPFKRHTENSEFADMKKTALKRVEILYMYEGCDGMAFESALERGCGGLVSAGTGNGGVIGHIMKKYNDAGEKEAADLPILVRSARVPTGGVSGAYRKETPGGLRVIPSHDLNPQKAYILLKLALAVTDDPSEIKRMFEQY